MPAKTEELSSFSPLVQKLLSVRGIVGRDDAERFLNPNWERDIYDPFGILNMDKAVSRVLRAVKDNEKIVLYTDYDCDGIPAGVILHDFFKKIGHTNFENYIPHRHNEGYGVNISAVEKIAENGATLIITADLGITDIDAVARAGELGVDVIVTDHHLPQEGKLPPAFTILNSKQTDDTYQDKMLCGAGVAFKLVQALLQKGEFNDIPAGWEKWLLDMAGLSTVADMVPLKNENRALAYFGLKVLRKSRRKGLQMLLRKNRINQEHLTEDDIGFMIAPRLNAAGRMDHPLRAFELLSTDDDALAEELSDHLNHLNDQRKAIVAAITKDAKRRLREREAGEVLVVGNPEWEPGILGLAANALVEEFSRPAFVWGRGGDGIIKGSCRSDGTVSLVELMQNAPVGTFLGFGGHAASGGWSVSLENIHTLETILSETYRGMEKKGVGEELFVDVELSFDDVNWKTYGDIEKFAPFGMENPKPVFLFRAAQVFAVKKFGKVGEHLELQFRNSSGGKIPAIAFFASEKLFGAKVGETVNLAATFEKSMFRNYPELRLRIVDITNNQ